jgi:hypothetical protein
MSVLRSNALISKSNSADHAKCLLNRWMNAAVKQPLVNPDQNLNAVNAARSSVPELTKTTTAQSSSAIAPLLVQKVPTRLSKTQEPSVLSKSAVNEQQLLPLQPRAQLQPPRLHAFVLIKTMVKLILKVLLGPSNQLTRTV